MKIYRILHVQCAVVHKVCAWTTNDNRLHVPVQELCGNLVQKLFFFVETVEVMTNNTKLQCCNNTFFHGM